jgi:hypothetical protein
MSIWVYEVNGFTAKGDELRIKSPREGFVTRQGAIDEIRQWFKEVMVANRGYHDIHLFFYPLIQDKLDYRYHDMVCELNFANAPEKNIQIHVWKILIDS